MKWYVHLGTANYAVYDKAIQFTLTFINIRAIIKKKGGGGCHIACPRYNISLSLPSLSLSLSPLNNVIYFKERKNSYKGHAAAATLIPIY